MKFSVAAVAAFVAGASATYNVTYTTEVVTAYTTYCPGPTVITHGPSTYTVTEATTLTITDCPCTVTQPIYSSSSAAPIATSAPYVNGTAPVTSAVVPVPTGGVPTEVAPTGAPTGGPAPSGTAPGAPTGAITSAAPIATGAAGKAFAVSGAGLVGALGLAAYLL